MSTFFVRWRGQVSGPYGEDDLREMLRSGKLSKHHQISSDRSAWDPIRQVAEFRADCEPKRTLAPSSGRIAGTIGAQIEVGGGRKLSLASDSIPLGSPVSSSDADVRYVAEDPGPGWYYVKDGASAGPVSADTVAELADRGELGPRTPVCPEGAQNWRPAQDAFPQLWDERAEAVQARGASDLAPSVYAGFWSRFCALLLDALVLAAIGGGCGIIIGLTAGADFEPALTLLGFILQWLYFALSESSPSQATPGKRALGLVVSDLEGRRISFARASGRYFAKILSSAILMIGYLMAAFTERKQALHDLMAGTVVIRQLRP